LQFWDTAGEEKFRAVTPMYYRNASAVVIVYDITDEETFNSVPRWLKEV
jgi:GTPase SAR1 family protein